MSGRNVQINEELTTDPNVINPTTNDGIAKTITDGPAAITIQAPTSQLDRAFPPKNSKYGPV